MKKLLLASAIVASTSVTGCATIFEGPTQNFKINTVNDTASRDTRCNVTNEEGTWGTYADGGMTIHRDGNPMKVECRNDTQVGVTEVEPRFQAEYLVLDIIWDACILTLSCVIDGVNNSFYEYPPSVDVYMEEDRSDYVSKN